MCGIAGLLSAQPIAPETVRRMTDPIAHRGPDDQGVWIDAEAGVGLGHRRLSIVDLSPLGHQPMASNDGRWVLDFNGEIYNHQALRRELEEASGVGGNGLPWRGHSDTETLIECIAVWGLVATLGKCVGMFALALWDRQERRLHLARDRFGEKPLYYGWAGGDFVFGSELKAIRTHPRFDNEIDRRAVRLLAARAYIPAPLSIYKRIYKLEPGCVLSVGPGAWRTPRDSAPSPDEPANGIAVERYWSYRAVVQAGLADSIGDEDEALYQLEEVLAASIQGQAVADVPVGAFSLGWDRLLDGGRALPEIFVRHGAHLFDRLRGRGVQRGRPCPGRRRPFRTEHHERIVTVKEAQEVIPRLPTMYDEPFADSSQIPTHLVSRFAREQVTVALSGDAGDELFGGYNRHVQAPAVWNRIRRVPRPLRAALGAPLGRVPGAVWNRLAKLPGRVSAPPSRHVDPKGLRTVSRARGVDDIYNIFLDEWSFENAPVLGAEGAPLGFDMDLGAGAPDAVRMMYGDAVSYLPDDILCKVDRAAMAVSLETRVPFLDHRVAELAARIPVALKIKGGVGKHILRQLLFREAPRALFERPKAGFGIPVGEWIRGPMRDWAESLLDRRRLTEQGFFDADVIHRRWAQHLRGERDATQAMWAVLMFQAWAAEERAR
jgi:asparagine synthase (glutamine-hydrolysing)